MVYTKPEVSDSIGRLTFLWQDLDLKVVTERMTDEGSAELCFYHSNGQGDSLLHRAKVNLLSTPTLNQVAKRMLTHSPKNPWTQILTCISSTTVEYQRKGEPGEILSPIPGTVEHPGYYIDPLIIKGLPTILHGEKGTHKTTLGIIALGVIANGIYDSPTGLTAIEPAKVGFLDWENDRQTTLYTASRLINADTIPFFEFAYMRMYMSLSDDIHRIAEFVHDQKLEVLLIDSLGGAAGSDQFDSAGKRAALKFFENLRKLKVTSLIIGQEAKNEEGKKTIYGSVYYRYYARSVFELRAKRDEMNPSVSHIALFHTDANYSQLHEPMGFIATHSPDSILVESEPLRLSDFIEKVSQTKMLLEFLTDGAKTRQAISENLGISLNQVDQILSRAKKRGIVLSLGSGLWGRIAKPENQP